MTDSHRNILLRLVCLAAILIVWQAFSVVIHDSRLFPGIDYVWQTSLPSIASFEGRDENIFTALLIVAKHAGITIFRIAIGLTFGYIIGTATGIAVYFFHQTRHANIFLLSAIRAVPLFALIPLFVYWFGGSEFGIYAYIGFGVFVIVATNTYEAVCNVSPDYVLQAKLLGANQIQTLLTIHMRAIEPEMLAAMRNVVGFSWAFSLGAEYLSSTSGLGYLVYQSYLYSDMGKLIIFALLYGFLGVASYKLLQVCSASRVSWRMADPST